MINVYDSKETNFEHNGLAALNNAIRCEVEEELNGFYGLEMEYPILNNKTKYLVEDNIIKAPTPTGLQLFRIYKKVKNMSSIIIYARHIFYDLLDNIVESCRTGNADGYETLQYILNSTQYAHPFDISTDIAEVHDAYYVRKNPVQILMGEDKNSFLNLWGGEIKRDNFNIEIMYDMGEDNGVTIRYGKNLIGIEEDLDTSEVVTKIMPTGLEENDTVVFLPERYISSPLIGKYPHPRIKHIHYSDIKVHTKQDENDTEEVVTLEDVYIRLREKVRKLYEEQKIDIPTVNYKVDFVELSKTEEYKDYKILETVNIGDTVTVKHEKLDIDIKAKCIKYKFDCITKKYIEIELGNFKKNLNDAFNEINEKIEELKKKTDDNKTDMDKAVEVLTKRADEQIIKAGEQIAKTDELSKYIDSLTADLGAFKVETNNMFATKVGDEEFASYKIQTANLISSKVAAVDDKLESYRTQTAGLIADKVSNTDFESYRTQTAGLIADKVSSDYFNSYRVQTDREIMDKVSSSEFSSYTYQTDNKIGMVVDGNGNINAASIALAISNNSSAISMIADRIEIKPTSGVIDFPNGTSVDTRDSYGLNRSNFIRLRASDTCYVCLNGNGDSGLGNIALYFKGPDGGSHAYWSFTRGTLFKNGEIVL